MLTESFRAVRNSGTTFHPAGLHSLLSDKLQFLNIVISHAGQIQLPLPTNMFAQLVAQSSLPHESKHSTCTYTYFLDQKQPSNSHWPQTVAMAIHKVHKHMYKIGQGEDDHQARHYVDTWIVLLIL